MKHGLAEVNGAQIYYEIRGSGPPLLLIMGLTGDAGWFEPLAELVAKQFTVVTYDRRANSRSPRPEGWTSTSIAEQADDAAGLLSALRLSPAIVFGNSFGAMILLELIVRHPRLVRGAVAHEPPLMPLLHQAHDVADFLKTKVAKGDLRNALREFTELKEGEAINGLDPSMMRRAFDNGDVVFFVEMPVVISYKPNAEALRRSNIPIFVAAGEETAMHLFCASKWLATQLKTDLHMLPSGHVGYVDRPREFATALISLVEKIR